MDAVSRDYESLPLVTYPEAVQDGQAPGFITEVSLEGVRNFIVRRADGSFVRLQQNYSLPCLVQGIPHNSRAHLLAWLERVEAKGQFPAAVLDFKRMLASESQLREFWEWFEKIEYSRSKYLLSAVSITDAIWRAKRLPGKPGNMTPKQREGYFKTVRKHAYALMELLYGTKFNGTRETPLTDDQLDESLDKALYLYGEDEDEEGHIVAFRVTPYEKSRIHYDYPSCALIETLEELADWTYWDDQWDGNIFGSSAPIAQSISASIGNSPPDQDPDGDSVSFVFDMRLPGQRYDVASGLNQNYFREYDPGTGRYSQSDPIGLRGGVSTFGYANAAPLMWSDPSGLISFQGCSSSQQVNVLNAIIDMSNSIIRQAESFTRCGSGDCDLSKAANVMREVATATYECSYQQPNGLTALRYGVIKLSPQFASNPAHPVIASGTDHRGAGCLKSALYHEAMHLAYFFDDEDDIRRETRKCFPCARNHTEGVLPL